MTATMTAGPEGRTGPAGDALCGRAGCGRPLPAAERGRSRRFCSDECRRRHYNALRGKPAPAPKQPNTRPPGMGVGDVKAAAGLGTMLAWRGWTAFIAGGFAGFLLAAVYGAALLISGRGTRKHQIPFGPFMIAGAFLVILVGML